LLSLSLLQPVLYYLIAMWNHPDKLATQRALAYLPVYIVWHVAAAFRTVLGG
jgi:hypothetical protein